MTALRWRDKRVKPGVASVAPGSRFAGQRVQLIFGSHQCDGSFLVPTNVTEARELLRGLVDTVTLYPEGKSQRVEVRDELAEILGLAAGARGKVAADPAVLAEQIKLVAGTGFEPVTFRL